MRRIVVVGSSGVGKSTLARELARRLAVPHIELDDLYWEPNWQATPDDVFRRKIEAAISREGWTVCGNYTRFREVLWPKADTLVWLDYPMSLVMWQVVKRTVSRCWTGEQLWESRNTESWRLSFFDRESVIAWAWRTWRTQRQRYIQFFRSQEYPHMRRFRFASPRQAKQWLNGIHDASHY